MRVLAAVIALVLLAGAKFAQAQGPLEIIPLRHRTVEQVLPVLRPLLEPGGVMSGQANQLFVRTSPRNLEEIRSALAAIDTPARRLVISVRLDGADASSQRNISASGTIQSGNVTIGNRPPSPSGTRVEIRAQDQNSSGTERVDQRIQVLEGGRAYIFTGGSRPLAQSQTGQMQEATSGFEVIPRTSGSSVTLEIARQRESFGPQGGVQGESMATTVRGRLGEWIELGGAAQDRARNDRGILASSGSRSTESRSVWVKVDEVR